MFVVLDLILATSVMPDEGIIRCGQVVASFFPCQEVAVTATAWVVANFKFMCSNYTLPLNLFGIYEKP